MSKGIDKVFTIGVRGEDGREMEIQPHLFAPE